MEYHYFTVHSFKPIQKRAGSVSFAVEFVQWRRSRHWTDTTAKTRDPQIGQLIVKKGKL
jgi:hypothetical protein